MDPISLTASAIAILQLTSDLVKATQKFYKGVKNAPKDVADLFSELTAFGVLLERLKAISQKAEETRLPQASAAGSSQKSIRLPMLQQMVKDDGPLAICYTEMLTFKERLAEDQSQLKRSLKWPFRKDEILAVVHRLRNLRSLLDTAIASDHLTLNIMIQESIISISDTLRTATDRESSSKISNWLSAPDPSSNFAIARKKRQEDTGNWLLDSQEFETWKTTACSLLWIHGKAGAGKTVLSSTAIHSLQEKEKSANVLYFYFDFQTLEKQLVLNFLKAVIVQLLSQNDKTLTTLEGLYLSHSRGCSTPALQDLIDVFLRMVETSRSVYLIIDALDECKQRQLLLETLEDIHSRNAKDLHTLVTSRQETDIQQSLSKIATGIISLEESVIEGDIVSYVQHQLRHDAKLCKWSDDVRNEIQAALLNGAGGMFRWVECQLDAIRGCMKLGLLRKSLKSLPKTLDDTYARILNSIPEDYVEDVRRILSVLIYSFYPISVQEIAETIPVVVDGEAYYDLENRLSESQDILTICSGLVIATDRMRTSQWGGYQIPIEELRLAHFSVKEYIVSDRILSQNPTYSIPEEHQAHELIARLCTRYLLWCHQEGLCEGPDFLSRYELLYKDRAALAPYAASMWSRHLLTAHMDSASPVYRELLEMFKQPTIVRDLIRLRRPWFRHEETNIMRTCGYIKGRSNEYIDITVDAVPALLYASLLGLDSLVIMLLDQGADINCSGPEGTCLAAAAGGGHLSTVQLLLSKGADVNGRVLQIKTEDELRYSRTAIHEAAEKFVFSRDEAIIRLLLASGADVNIGRSSHGKIGQGFQSNTPLQAVVGYALLNLVRLFLGAGADPNALITLNDAPLGELCSDKTRPESFEILRMLLDAGADPNMTSDPRGLRTPLFYALSENHMQAARLLIEQGVDRHSIDCRIVRFITSRQGPNERTLRTSVETLAQLRPDIDLANPLIVAARYGYVHLVDFLLRSGTAPDSRDINGTAALHAAAFTPACNTAIVKLLLDAGASTNIYGGQLGGALQAAALSGKPDVVEVLLEHGAMINHRDGRYGSALQIARLRLHEQELGFPETWRRGDGLARYGPNAYFGDDNYSIYFQTLSTRKTPQNQGYEVQIDIPHRQGADYRGVVDLLLSHGAEER